MISSISRRSAGILGWFALVKAVAVALVLWLIGLALPLAVVAGLLIGLGVAALFWAKAPSLVTGLFRAEPVSPDGHARLHNLVEGLCVTHGVEKPTLLVIDDDAANGFVVGRGPKDASLGVTSGLLDQLDRVELEGVLAALLIRVRDEDLGAATVAIPLAGFMTVMGDQCIRKMWWNGGRSSHADRSEGSAPYMGKVGRLIFRAASPLAALLKLAAKPASTVALDADAAAMTRFPPGLIAGLSKMDQVGTVSHAGLRSTCHLWLATPIAIDPSQGELSDVNRCYDAHPPLRSRIETLQELYQA